MIRGLSSSQHYGIRTEEDEMAERASRFDCNTKRVPRLKSLWRLICEQLEDRILRILIVAAIVSLVVGMVKDGPAEGWMDGFTISLAVIIVVSISAGNDYAKQKQF